LVDGAHSWGSFDATPGRYGLRRYRLVIFPPGITATDRRLLRLWRAWPLGGGAFALFAVTTGTRIGVRSMALIFLTEELNPDDRRSYAEWEAIVGVLTRADHMLSTGAITRPQHEALWWQAYDRLEAGAHV